MALAISLKIEVFPVRGGATISPLCPLPMGQTKSIMRSTSAFFCCSFSSVMRSFGEMGVNSSKGMRAAALYGGSSLIKSIYNNASLWSPSGPAGLVLPLI